MATDDTQTEMLAHFLELSALLGLQDTSYQELQEEVRHAVVASGIDDAPTALRSLRAYRVVDAVDIEQHDYIRWVRSAEASPSGRASGPTIGGVMTSVVDADDDEHTVRCAGRTGRFFQVTTRPGVWLFKLMSEQEAVILNVLEALDRGSTEEPTARPVSPS